MVAFDEATALADQRVKDGVTVWRNLVCSQYEFAVSDLRTYQDAGGIIGLDVRVAAVMDWGVMRQLVAIFGTDIGASACPDEPPAATTVVQEKLVQEGDAWKLIAYHLGPEP